MDRNALYGRIVWILKNHDTETAILQDQIEMENNSLQEDLDRIYGAVGIKAVEYDNVKVISSVKGDSKIASAIAKAEARRIRHERKIEQFQTEMEAIDSVYKLITLQDGMNRAVLLTLYYPYRSYSDAARILGYSIQSIVRFRSQAIDALVDVIMSQS